MHRNSVPKGIKIVKNRDIPTVSQLLCAMQEVEELEARIAWEEARMRSTTARLTGNTGGGGIKTGFDEPLAEIDELCELHREKLNHYARVVKKSEAIIASIGSQSMQTFVTMLYVRDMPPEQVRAELGMSEWGFRKAREAVEQARDMKSVAWSEKYAIHEENLASPLDSQTKI